MSTKNSVLELLENQKGQSLSGETIANSLGISRNAVWKAVKELQKEGFLIDAVKNKGYSLSLENDIISQEGIKAYLSENNKKIEIKIFKELQSTSKTAKEMAIGEAKHGTVVIAETQKSGKGRFSRSFFSPQGGLYMSIILRPEILKLKKSTSITALTGLCVCKSIEDICKKSPKIKWVNDVYLENKKICGILTEAVTDFESGNLQWIVLGIGINFCKKNEEIPEEMQDIIGFVYENENPSATRNRLAAEIINLILNSWFKNEKSIFEEYKNYLMMLGQKITVIQANNSFEAEALDINDSGHLIVKKETGDIMALNSGEISIKLM